MTEQRTELLIEPHVATDETLWAAYNLLPQLDGDLHEILQPSKEVVEAAHERFYASGMTENPDLRPVAIDNEALGRRETALLDLKKQLGDHEANDIQKAYRWKVNEELAKLRMVQATMSGKRRLFESYNKFIYGEVNKEVYGDTLDWFRNEALQHLGSQEASVSEAAENVLALLPDAKGDWKRLCPSDEVFAEVRRQQFRSDGYYALLTAGVTLPAEGPVAPETGDPILRQALDNIGGKYGLVDASRSTWSVGHQRHEYARPAEYNMPLKRFVGLALGHEPSHILERENGLRQPLRLTADGLDRYEQGNEGRALVREQVVYDKPEDFMKLLRWRDVMRRHLAISLATGPDGTSRTFAEVYKIVNAVDVLFARAAKPKDIEVADALAHKRTWNLLALRTHRGTDGQGGAFWKDKVYLEGNVASWRAAADNPEIIDLGDNGKFDINNPRHIALLQALSVLPSQKA